ncbi:hypothetical protein AHA02nite_12080 [Alkalibacillus haloalkaliphilus]|uniref:Uncharacterized protein n=2 Tax=Alkalibacillus haloalkaliphilus TaxID=94136 RepID=A0A511W7R7_9BACI|nr:hypothetical protein AHA02nite_12080 [Alkalibacillus haloalkaliphilus]
MCCKDDDMNTVSKEQGYKKIPLSSKELKELSVKPKIEDGKLKFDQNKESHRYIMGEND